MYREISVPFEYLFRGVVLNLIRDNTSFFFAFLFHGNDKHRWNDLDCSEITVNVTVVEVGSPRCPVDSMLHALVIFLAYSCNYVLCSFAL